MEKVKDSDIARYFQESVSFDFEKEDIISYQQIEQLEDDFFTLIDRDAYIALLNDILSYDNQLKNIFIDLFDTKLGIHCFANKNARYSPRSRITYFLAQTKYQHYQNSIAKVYLAFNTWLIFFGDAPVEPKWKNCPFCGSVVKNDICTNNSCKKTNTDSLKAALELTTLLAEEKVGINSLIPSCWYYINENSEFYNEYKSNILTYKNKRKAREDEQKNRTLDAASKEINQIKTLLKLEITKTKPDFEMIIKSIENSKTLQSASKYDDRGFIQRLAIIKKTVETEKQKYENNIEKETKAEIFNQSVNDFIALTIILEEELLQKTNDLEYLSENLKKADTEWAKVKANLRFTESKSDEVIEIINKYESDLRQKTIEYIEKEKYNREIKGVKTKLINAITTINNELNCLEYRDNKTWKLVEELNDKIETNSDFDKIRLEEPQVYLELVTPLRKRLAKFTKEENAYKLENLRKESSLLENEIEKANPQDMLSNTFVNEIEKIKNNPLYSTINQTVEYYSKINALEKNLNFLIINEKEYNKVLENSIRRKKLKKKIIFLSIGIFIILLILILFIIIKKN